MEDWKFGCKWMSAAESDGKVLERTAYGPVLQFLRWLGFMNADADVSEGHH